MNTEKVFEKLEKAHWKKLFFDSGTDNWKKYWFLDGENARVFNNEQGMEFYSGPRFGNDADHAVLWTKNEFSGDLKISFDFCRLDNADKCVNIIYLLATGTGDGPYTKDIYQWKEARKIPSMRLYFNYMNLYHISYAAFGLKNSEKYIRARQYSGTDLPGTEIKPDYDPGTLFEPMVYHKMTVIKKGADLYLKVENAHESKLCHWQLDPEKNLDFGRIGLRQMYTRNARYANIGVWTID